MGAKIPTDTQVKVTVWKQYADDTMTDLYTVSCGQRAICYEMPKEQALGYLSEFFDEM